MTVDIQTGDRHVRETGPLPDLAPATPPRAQTATPLKRSLQKRLAARRAMGVIAEGAALGTPDGSERPYFKVRGRTCRTVVQGLCGVMSLCMMESTRPGFLHAAPKRASRSTQCVWYHAEQAIPWALWLS